MISNMLGKVPEAMVGYDRVLLPLCKRTGNCLKGTDVFARGRQKDNDGFGSPDAGTGGSIDWRRMQGSGGVSKIGLEACSWSCTNSRLNKTVW